METGKTNDELRQKIVTLASSFRQGLRKQNKKLKRKDSLNQDDSQPYIDPEAITEYLDLMNDFIKNSIKEEMEAFSP